MGKVISFFSGFQPGKEPVLTGLPAQIMGLPDATQDAYLDRKWEQTKLSTLEKAKPGDWGWESLMRIQNLDGTEEASGASDEADLAAERQNVLIDLIQAQYGTELGLPGVWTECCQWLYDHVEDLRGRSPLFEEYFWLCRQMNFQRAEEVRQRGLRVVG